MRVGTEGMNQPKKSKAKKSQSPEEKTDFLFPPLRNGIDYLSSVVDLLTKHETEQDPRNLKYVVLHLQAAVEVLLKSRLQLEHWSLVFKDSNKAKRESYNSGNFQSVTPDEAVRRLIEIVGIKISDDERKELTYLVNSRNALQHWGHVDSVNALEARAAKVLDFLIWFIDEDLYPKLEGEVSNAVAQELDEIREGLNQIQRFVKERLERLEPQLQTVPGSRVHCPDCENFSLIVSDTVDKCYFCPQEWDLHRLVERYAEFSCGYSIHTLVSEGERDPRHACFECGQDTLVLDVVVDELDNKTNMCFACVETFRDVEYCGGCGDLVPVTDGHPWCQSCYNHYMS
ncbi:hypothetical protein [Nocardiopsis metallicus]|uniref:Uncharacterized protein n=1 Tax=Nocardiopsis metallicus TaxID=179819 RepID=A0A840W1A4_9ACTN|nr:hypothetical protein [Nocardiopsis metallicus]MBB5489053.1 hypothetical protein [Nocardiopsis metallicus]